MSVPIRQRSYDRAPDELRPTVIEPGFVRTATGSALISVGETRVICTASVQNSVPRWLAGSGRGWVTAEYGMLPASTGERKQRDVRRGRPDGRADAALSRPSRRAARAGRRWHRLAPGAPGTGGRRRRPMSAADVSSLVLGTRNRHKVREIGRLLAPAGIAVKPLPDGIELPPEHGATFAENALPKARAAAAATGRPAIADDSGIGAEALHGGPGVRSARYAGPGATDEQNLRKLLREVPPGDRLRYVCALSYVDPVRDIERTFFGECRGRLATDPRGTRG